MFAHKNYEPSRLVLAAATIALAACGSDSDYVSGVDEVLITPLVATTAGFSIDETEVTQGQYAAWLRTRPSVVDQPSTCRWNDNFAPDETCQSAFSEHLCQGPECGSYPQVCVDWCDANAYCRGVGKRLCGRIDGGRSDFAAYADPAESQWYNACSAAGHHPYPYGDTRDTQACNGVSRKTGGPESVGALLTCQSNDSGYAGVMDLSGNVWEWEDSCDRPDEASALCRVRGGSFASAEESLRCADDYTYVREFASYYVGFRCCAP